MDFLRLDRVSYTYPGKKSKAVDQVSTNFSASEKVVITGRNGSGKSTLVKLMVKMLVPQQGAVFLEGRDLKTYRPGEIGKRVGLLLQNPIQMLFCPSVYDEVTFALKWHGMSREECRVRAEEHLRYFELWPLRHRHPFTLSGGEQQLLALAAITAIKPRCLILDEPTKGLDGYQLGILETLLADLWSQGMGLIVISHNQRFLQRFGGRRIEMAGGRVVFDGA